MGLSSLPVLLQAPWVALCSLPQFPWCRTSLTTLLPHPAWGGERALSAYLCRTPAIKIGPEIFLFFIFCNWGLPKTTTIPALHRRLDSRLCRRVSVFSAVPLPRLRAETRQHFCSLAPLPGWQQLSRLGSLLFHPSQPSTPRPPSSCQLAQLRPGGAAGGRAGTPRAYRSAPRRALSAHPRQASSLLLLQTL